MPDTATNGQTELVRQFYAQIDKDGFIIDERFNSGGQLSDRFVELLDRPTTQYLAWRNGEDVGYPTMANQRPKVMLMNGWSGSGGDAFPWTFKNVGLGPLIGERTWGGLIGPSSGHQLIDGGGVTVPPGRLYGPDGVWFPEGRGVEPDIFVVDDPSQLANGVDPQLERAIEEVMALMEANPADRLSRPAPEDRTARGQRRQQ